MPAPCSACPGPGPPGRRCGSTSSATSRDPAARRRHRRGPRARDRGGPRAGADRALHGTRRAQRRDVTPLQKIPNHQYAPRPPPPPPPPPGAASPLPACRERVRPAAERAERSEAGVRGGAEEAPSLQVAPSSSPPPHPRLLRRLLPSAALSPRAGEAKGASFCAAPLPTTISPLTSHDAPLAKRRSYSSTALSSTCAPAAHSSKLVDFGLVVAEAAGAGHEDHRRRRDAGDVGGVVAGARDHVARRESPPSRCRRAPPRCSPDRSARPANPRPCAAW